MTYIRGIWLFGNSTKGNLELILSKRYKTVENRVKNLLNENYVEIPNDKEIKEWFIFYVLYENVANFSAANVPLVFRKNCSGGVFSIDNIDLDEFGKIDKDKLIKISQNQLLNYMKIDEEKYVWPFMYSFNYGYFLLILLSLETSVLTNEKAISIYKIRSVKQQSINELETLKFVEIRVGLQLLEDLLELLGIDQEDDKIDVNKILKIWRIMIPFGSPILNKKEVENILSKSSDSGIPKYLSYLLNENYNSSQSSIPVFDNFNQLKNEINFDNKFLQGNVYLDSINDELDLQEVNTNIDFNDDFIPMVSPISNKNLLLGDMLNYGIGKLSSKTKNSNNLSNGNQLIKFSLIEIICCFAKKHPMITNIENKNSIIEEDSINVFIERMGEPYSSFISGIFEFSGKLPNSVSISCNVILPWQKILIESKEDDKIKKYIPPYISVQDNISCTKLADELYDKKSKSYKIIKDYQEIDKIINDKLIPISRYKINWNSAQTNCSKIFSYWYPFEKEIPVKGYFTVIPETQEPVKQVTQSDDNFRPILIHTFQMEYCLCFDPSIIRGMEICQVSIPLIPGSIHRNSKYNIPRMVIFSHTLKTSMGQVNITPDKKSILWTINNPQEIFTKKGSNHKHSTLDSLSSIIQIRLNGSIKLRLLYKENKFNKSNNFSNQNFCEDLTSPIIESYLLNTTIESGIPSYHSKLNYKNNSTFYTAPNPFGIGIQPLLNHPIKDIDPIWLIELHPKIAKFAENSKKLTQKELYNQLMELIFSYSLVSFVVNSFDSTYRGVTIPQGSIHINPKALQYEEPEIFSNSGKYIIWRNG